MDLTWILHTYITSLLPTLISTNRFSCFKHFRVFTWTKFRFHELYSDDLSVSIQACTEITYPFNSFQTLNIDYHEQQLNYNRYSRDLMEKRGKQSNERKKSHVQWRMDAMIKCIKEDLPESNRKKNKKATKLC